MERTNQNKNNSKWTGIIPDLIAGKKSDEVSDLIYFLRGIIHFFLWIICIGFSIGAVLAAIFLIIKFIKYAWYF